MLGLPPAPRRPGLGATLPFAVPVTAAFSHVYVTECTYERGTRGVYIAFHLPTAVCSPVASRERNARAVILFSRVRRAF